MAEAAPVEARSLSSVTSIAANPPAYPRNPTQALLDRLVLYIVKVPGSQDVILTPLKPPTKSNISSEAVNSSLYYLHVATEADEDVLRAIESEYENQQDAAHPSRLSTETVHKLNDFHRKPVGSAQSQQPPQQQQQQPQPQPQQPSEIPPPLPLRPHEVPPDLAISRKPAVAREDPAPPYPSGEDRIHAPSYNHSPLQPPPGRSDDSGVFTIPRRPVSMAGPLPVSAGSGLNSHFTPVSAQADYDRGRPRISLDNEYPSQERRSSNMTEKTPSPVTPNHHHHHHHHQKPPSPFKITLIRRDPASGHQWNVGTISSADEDRGSIHIEITNPGYGKFLNNETFSLPTGSGHAENANTAEAIKAMIRNSTAHNGERDTVFHREVVPIRHCHSHSGSKAELFHRRSGSADWKLADVVSAKVSRGYYSFTSPWNGTCAFVASINGLGIKCKHTIPGPSHDISGHNHAEVTVSEIRFNTPFPLDHNFRSPLLSVWGEKGGKRGAFAQMITSNIQKVQQARTRARSESNPNRPVSGSSSEDLTADEDRLDLSLAREPGGGGLSGRSAKLGKLIIEDEGIKMIDLVVAASMGVWWRTCHRGS